MTWSLSLFYDFSKITAGGESNLVSKVSLRLLAKVIPNYFFFSFSFSSKFPTTCCTAVCFLVPRTFLAFSQLAGDPPIISGPVIRGH